MGNMDVAWQGPRVNLSISAMLLFGSGNGHTQGVTRGLLWLPNPVALSCYRVRLFLVRKQGLALIVCTRADPINACHADPQLMHADSVMLSRTRPEADPCTYCMHTTAAPPVRAHPASEETSHQDHASS